MTVAEELVVVVRADFDQARRQIRLGQTNFKQFADRAEKDVNRIGSAARTLGRTFAGLAVAGALTRIGSSIFNTAKQMELLNARLVNLSGSEAAAAEATAFLNAQADSLSVGIISLTDAYTKLLPFVSSNVLSMGEMRDILTGLVEVQKSAGASAAQLDQTFFGLSQALQNPILRAEELNQVVDPLPGLLQQLDRAFAEITGVTDDVAGSFRRATVAGEVTSDMFRDVLIVALNEYRGTAADMADTTDATMTRLSNAWTNFADTIGQMVLPTLNTLLATMLEIMTPETPQQIPLEMSMKAVADAIKLVREEISGLQEDLESAGGMDRVTLAHRLVEAEAELARLLREQTQLRVQLNEEEKKNIGTRESLVRVTDEEAASLARVAAAGKPWEATAGEMISINEQLSRSYADQVDSMDALRDAGEQATDTLIRGFTDGLSRAEDFNDVLNVMLDTLSRIATDVAGDQLSSAFSGLFGGGGGGGGFGGFLSGIGGFLGIGGGDLAAATAGGPSGLGFAAGGNPPVGQASLVGEKGPELFVPKVPGTIIPAGDTQNILNQSGASAQVNLTFDLSGATASAVDALTASLPMITEHVKSATMSAIQSDVETGGPFSRMMGGRR